MTTISTANEIRKPLNKTIPASTIESIASEAGTVDKIPASSSHNDEQQQQEGWCKVKVLYVLPKHAKVTKTALTRANVLHTTVRMTPADPKVVPSTLKNCIAIPVVDECDYTSSNKCQQEPQQPWMEFVADIGHQLCPLSTKLLGNNKSKTIRVQGRKQKNDNTTSGGQEWNLTPAQQALLKTIQSSRNVNDEKDSVYMNAETVERISNLDTSVCPKKFQVFGDDRTLVIPPGAFQSNDFYSVLMMSSSQLLSGSAVGKSSEYSSSHDSSMISNEKSRNNINNGGEAYAVNTTTEIEAKDKHFLNRMEDFWKYLAEMEGCSRIVRRGAIDRESRVRESGHRLIWPFQGISEDTGPGSPGWITVTEQGIKQSFDMTRVMFSRGNISEKIRFGKYIVSHGDQILDMYAGIGYYTLPGIIHGGAGHVVACEWNEHAVAALRYNIKNNNIPADRVTILVGDCRVLARQNRLVNMFDRVNLGLLPSSEGGWPTAIRALKFDTGGWLHIHGNVPEKEIDKWAIWVCHSLWLLVKDERRKKKTEMDKHQDNQDQREEEAPGKELYSDWIVLCTHVERVKSFAPTVSHYVADVFVGPPPPKDKRQQSRIQLQGLDRILELNSTLRAGVMLRDGPFIPCTESDIQPPSCALSSSGALSQAWMREESPVD